jgi:cytochrome c peroxidase
MKNSQMALVIAGAFVMACSGVGAGSEPAPESGDPAREKTDVPAKGPQPMFGPTQRQNDPPPPISGGTLAILRDGRAFAADPDRDRLYLVDLDTSALRTIALRQHDEPGRIAQDGAGRVHVVLRRGGDVVTVDPTSATIIARRHVCASPRGIAFDSHAARLVVACEGGELMTMTAAPTGVPTLLARLDRDLRDVVVAGETIFVSRFRSAEVLSLTLDGTEISRTRPGTADSFSMEPSLAWRMIPPPESMAGAFDGQTPPVVVHQATTMMAVSPKPNGYAGSTSGQASCGSPGSGIVTPIISQGATQTTALPSEAVLPVDVAWDGSLFAVIAAGNGHTPGLPQLWLTDITGCRQRGHLIGGQAIALAVRSPGSYVIQTRQPAALSIVNASVDEQKPLREAPIAHRVIELAMDTREDTGHAIFHSNSGAGIACASCHGEGGDDGRVWDFGDGIGARRTPSLRGTIEGTAPYHWDGKLANVGDLVDEVMTKRMNGPSLDEGRKDALSSWLFSIPPPAPASGIDGVAAVRGKTLFESSDLGCSSCHAGPKLTTSATVDVGTGGAFQVPSLVGVSARAPFLHDGCAATLADRFLSCGSPQHGRTSQLSSVQIDDLVAYLSTL